MKGPIFWDRQGNPIEDTIEWAQKFEDSEYRIVAVDQDDPGTPMVSTIWDGFDLAHNFNNDVPPMIFETVLLEANPDSTGQGTIVRSHFSVTEEEAYAAHRMFCHDHLNREPAPNNGLKDEIIRRERK